MNVDRRVKPGDEGGSEKGGPHYRGFLRPLNFGASPGLPALERPRTMPAGPGL
jgi:hypothetical protein